MDKLKMHTPNRADDNFAKLSALFPNAVTETVDENGQVVRAIDKEVLMQEISHTVVEGREERYQFTWPDKKKSVLTANAPINKTLRPCREESVNFDTTENLYIEGDNLEVLKLLQETYLGKVKMIYIDPPYNTGNDFVYEDDFAQGVNEYMESSGQYDEDGNRLFKNMDSNGRFHTDWLNMIYPRLKLARDLLTDDGVIFISIDDNEVENLKKICNEIFGEGNFVANLIWEKVHTRKNSAKYFSTSHEHILCYAKNKKIVDSDMGWQRNLLPRDNTNAYKNPDNDPRGVWKADPITAHNYYESDYKIHKPNGVILSRPQNRYWVYSEKSWYEKVKNDEVVWGDGASYPMVKRYLSNVQDGLVPITILYRENVGDSSQGNKDLATTLELGALFTYPKPIKLLMTLMQIGMQKTDIILDFFSGSATTAHAVMQLNAEDGGNRKFIMVQLPEVTDEKSEAYKAGYKNICEIGKERIRRAGKKIKEFYAKSGYSMQKLKSDGENYQVAFANKDSSIGDEYITNPDVVTGRNVIYDTPDNMETVNKEIADKIDIGFRVLKCDSSNMKDVYYYPEETDVTMFDNLVNNIKEDRTAEDLLMQVMLDLGVLLSSKIENYEINGKKIFSVADDYLIACFDDNVTDEIVEQIAKKKPYYFVMRDSSLADSSVAVNFEQLFKAYSADTIRMVI